MVLDTLPETPEQERQKLKQVDLTENAQHWHELRILKRNMDDATRAYKRYRERLGLKIGNADQIVVNGNVVANYTPGAFNTAKFVQENPGLAEKYMVKRTVEEFDTDRFADENPGLHLDYRTRSLRFVAE